MLGHAEHTDVLAGKQVHRQHRGVVHLRAVVGHGVQREARRERQFGIVPRLDERQRLLIDGDLQVLEVKVGDGKAEQGQVGHGIGKVDRHLPTATIHSDDRLHLGIDGTRLKQGYKRIVGQHKRRVSTEGLLSNACRQLVLHNGRGGNGVSHLIGCQQSGELVKDLRLQALYLTL